MRFNSVLGAMVFIVVASFMAMIIFVQTKSFGNLASRIISDISEKRAHMKVSISNIAISVFPPGIEMVKITIDKDLGENKRFQAELGRIGFYLSLIEIEERRLAFGEIRVADAVIDYDYPKKDDDADITKIDQKIIDEVFNYTQHLPVRVDTILVENTKVHVNHDLVDVRRFKLFKEDESFVARFHLANIKPHAEKELMIDEVWGDAQVDRKDIEIHRLKVQHNVHSVLVKGKIKNYPSLRDAHVSINGEGHLYLRAIRDFKLPGPLKLESGVAAVSFKTRMQKREIEIDSYINLKDLRSNLIYADSVTAKMTLKHDELNLIELFMTYKDQKLTVVDPVRVAHLTRKEYLSEPINGVVEDLKLSNALRILGPNFKPLKGKLSGALSFLHRKGDLFFTPASDFKINDLKLTADEKEKPITIIHAKEAVLKDAEFSVIDGVFKMGSFVILPKSNFRVDGQVGKTSGVNFSIVDAQLNLTDLGDIAKLGLTGKGKLSVDIAGPLDDTNFSFKGKMGDFGVLGYQLGQSDLDLNLSLKDSTVVIRRLESTLGKTTLSGNGAINYKNSDIALGLNSSSANIHDLSQILKPLFSKLTFLPQDFEMNAHIDAYIHGKTQLDKLKIKTNVKYTDLHGHGENISNGSFMIGMLNETVSINHFEGKKDKGGITGSYSIHLPTNMMKLKFEWGDLPLSSFNMTKRLGLNFDGLMLGKVEGEGQVKDYVLTLKNEITETKSQNYSYDDSHLDLKIMPDRLIGDTNLLGSTIKSKFDYSFTDARKSTVDLQVDMSDIKPFAVAIIGQHLEYEDFTGRFKFNLNSSFNLGFNHLDLKASLNELVFDHENFKVKYYSITPEFLVQDSHLEKWDLNIRQSDLYAVTKGSGTFGKNVSLINEFHLNSKILEILMAQVLSSDGFIRNIVRIDGNGADYVLSVTSRGENIGISVEGAPFSLNELKYSIDYVQNRLVIKELTTSLEGGTASVKGEVYFSGAVPDVNLKYNLDRAEIPILGKSSVNITGEGIILGNDLPYNFGGEIVVNKGQIVNELNDFDTKSSGISQVRYLPKNQESILGKLFNLNINIKADNPIRITNSLMDVAMKGEVRLFGNPVRLRGEGRMFSPINTSRIFFKNNEYFITNADINFSPRKELTNPDFDIQALTYISTYKINCKAYGDLERFNFDLTSDPALPRNSILSLIAFGYTDEIQSTLSQGEQQNLTQVGVGSFVFDRFKISDILNKQFGLQVNLGTVFEQSQTESMLAGRSQEGQGALGRTRSATKIELKKRLDEALTLSVSSTMGGSIGQRQSMNLTYSLNKKVQLEGVYELRTNAEGEEDVIDNSIGGDLKFRWTFK